MRVLITGSAGFIGSATALRLLERGDEVVGLDDLNDYYDVQLKLDRLARLQPYSNFVEARQPLEDYAALDALIREFRPSHVINLAAQAGVRQSITHPQLYIQRNLVGFANLLECCRHHQVAHLVYASSSSVYGASTAMPYSTKQPVDHPISLYAATKKSNELMAHTYSHLYGLPTTGLRFFTVYGPWGRPDMAAFLFTKAILEDKPITVFNYGNHKRDFTYIDDIVEGVVRITDQVAQPDSLWDASRPDPSNSCAPYRLYNIGNSQPQTLSRFIEVIEGELGKKAIKRMEPQQPGDVPETFADISALKQAIGYTPSTDLQQGMSRFVKWYREYYNA